MEGSRCNSRLALNLAEKPLLGLILYRSSIIHCRKDTRICSPSNLEIYWKLYTKRRSKNNSIFLTPAACVCVCVHMCWAEIALKNIDFG